MMVSVAPKEGAKHNKFTKQSSLMCTNLGKNMGSRFYWLVWSKQMTDTSILCSSGTAHV